MKYELLFPPVTMMKLSLLLAFVSALTFAKAQNAYKIQPLSSLIEINGTSTIHDWTSTVKNMQGSCNFVIVEGQLTEAKQLTFKTNANNIKSGKGSMDDNTYEALKTNTYPFITFTQVGASSVIKSGNGYKVTVPGKMTMAGKSQNIRLTATCMYTQDDWVCRGTYKFKMSSYGIKPPTAMMGAITTGDDLEIVFKLAFVK